MKDKEIEKCNQSKEKECDKLKSKVSIQFYTQDYEFLTIPQT